MTTINAATPDRICVALLESSNAAERKAAFDELCKRGLRYTGQQEAENAKGRRRLSKERGWAA